MRLVERAAGLRLVAAHLGGGLPFYAHMPEVRELCATIWFDTAALPHLYRPSAMRAVVSLVGAERLLLGTDFPLLGMSRYRRALDGAGLDERGARAGARRQRRRGLAVVRRLVTVDPALRGARLSDPADVQDGAGGVGEVVAEQPDDRGGHLLGAAGPAHRDRSPRAGRPVRLAPAGVDVGVDDAGADGVDPDPLGGDLAGQPEREGVDRPLARRVVDVLARAIPAGWRPRRR